MKTNLASLMSILSEEERKLVDFGFTLRHYAYNISIQELNGNVNITEDFKNDFDFVFEEVNKTKEKIIKIKSAINKNNNFFTLKDGRTIQEAIIENTILRKIKNYYEVLLEKRGSKKRITEGNSSYFECKTLNFDVKEIQNKHYEIEKRIQQTDFEISKLNSKEFEINI